MNSNLETFLEKFRDGKFEFLDILFIEDRFRFVKKLDETNKGNFDAEYINEGMSLFKFFRYS